MTLEKATTVAAAILGTLDHEGREAAMLKIIEELMSAYRAGVQELMSGCHGSAEDAEIESLNASLDELSIPQQVDLLEKFVRESKAKIVVALTLVAKVRAAKTVDVLVEQESERCLEALISLQAVQTLVNEFFKD